MNESGSNTSRRCGLKGRIPCALLAMGGWLCAAQAATNDPDAIPPLRPPRGEIGPSFWEEHGLAMVVSVVVFLLLVAVVIWLLTRPKPAVALSPAAQARLALEGLRGRSEAGPLLSEVSQILRRYLVAVFELPPGEHTTAEICQALSSSPRPGAELARSIAEFLRRCDERKFAPASPAGTLEAVPRALEFIDRAEARLAELQAAQALHKAPATKAE